MGDSSKTAGHHPDIALVATADTEASLLPAPDHWYTSMCTCGPLCTPWTHLGEWVRHCSAADPDPAASAVPTHTCLTLDPTEARPSLGPGTPDAGALPTGCQPQHQSLETLSGPHRRGPQLPRCHDTTVGVSSASTDDTPHPTPPRAARHMLCVRDAMPRGSQPTPLTVTALPQGLGKMLHPWATTNRPTLTQPTSPAGRNTTHPQPV